VTETLVLVAAGGAAWESAGIRQIEAASDLRLARRCVDVAELLAVTPSSGAHVAVVAAGLPGLDADAVFRLERSGVRVVGVGDGDRCQALGIAVRADPHDIPDAVTRLGSPVDRPEPEQEGRGRTIAVWGPTGAPGRSTIAVSLAAAQAHAGQDCVLVDADTSGGSVAQMLSMLDEVSGLVAACRAANQGRVAETADQLLGVEPRLRLLSGIPRADMASQLRAGALDLVLRHLRTAADLVVVDLGAPLDPVAELVLGQADVHLVVGRADPVGLTRLVRALHALRDTTTLEPLVVVNQMRPTLGWKERDVAATIARLTGHEPVQLVPSDVATLDRAIMRGEVPRVVDLGSPFVQAIDRLATDIPLVRSAVSH
jgi:MinD-like ATPase involved in chromosome partitioning or flagellar assembly